MTTPHDSHGKVYLVGAGPGDPGLITLRGVRCLQRADVVLYDYLVNPEILEHLRPETPRICLGSHGGERVLSQEEVASQVVDLASRGLVVVRLKGGDPLIFGRLAEEVEALTRHAIPFEIVPGITVAVAAGSYAGIPITHRGLASAVALITGQERPEKDASSLDYEALARFPGTLVFYMGVTTAKHWTAALIRAGKPAETPAAIVRKCSLPDQQTIRCRLDEIADRLVRPRKLRPPAVVIVGPVAAESHALNWFEQRPLFGQTILVTRPIEQVRDLSDKLAELGAKLLIQPAIEITDPPDWLGLDLAIKDLESYDWVVFSSSNGVRFFLDRLLQNKDVRWLAGSRLACIGPGTAESLARYHVRADLLPAEYRAESLAAALAPEAEGKRFLLVRASRGREILAEQLRDAGGKVEQVIAYSSSDVKQPDPIVLGQLSEGRIDWVTVTSSAIARSLATMFGQELMKSKLVSISPITSGVLRDLGFSPAAEASEYTMEGVIKAVLSSCRR